MSIIISDEILQLAKESVEHFKLRDLKVNLNFAITYYLQEIYTRETDEVLRDSVPRDNVLTNIEKAIKEAKDSLSDYQDILLTESLSESTYLKYSALPEEEAKRIFKKTLKNMLKEPNIYSHSHICHYTNKFEEYLSQELCSNKFITIKELIAHLSSLDQNAKCLMHDPSAECEDLSTSQPFHIIEMEALTTENNVWTFPLKNEEYEKTCVDFNNDKNQYTKEKVYLLCSKLNDTKKAIEWYNKSIVLDPKCSNKDCENTLVGQQDLDGNTTWLGPTCECCTISELDNESSDDE